MQSPQRSSMKPTSNVLGPVDGEYTFDQGSFLIPHEALGASMERANQVLEHYNPGEKSWQKPARLTKYFKDFLSPIIHDHHDKEEKKFFAEYSKLGVDNFSK
jgi:hypothetical protein